MSIRKVYLDLDTLFDTRLATLAQISQEVAAQIFHSNAYWDRDHTNWETLTQGAVTAEQYQTQWDARDNETLQASIITGIIPVLVNIVTEYHRSKKAGTVDYDLAIEINVHPYQLEMEEMDELTRILQDEVLNDDIGVQFISLSLEEMTFEYIKSRYSALVLFDFHHWLKIHCLELPQISLKGITFIVPRLFEHDPGALSIERKKEEVTAFKLWLLDQLTVEFIDARWFSLLRPEFKPS